MRIDRFPNGFIELKDDVLTLGGGTTTTIAVRDLRSVVARPGKKSLFSRNPPAVLEIAYAEGLGVTRTKLLIPVEALPAAEALARQLGGG